MKYKNIILITFLLFIGIASIFFYFWFSQSFTSANGTICNSYFTKAIAEELLIGDKILFEEIKKIDSNILDFTVSEAPSLDAFCPGKFTLRILSRNKDINASALDKLGDKWHGAQYIIEVIK